MIAAMDRRRASPRDFALFIVGGQQLSRRMIWLSVCPACNLAMTGIGAFAR
jgi:hypothetical protein